MLRCFLVQKYYCKKHRKAFCTFNNDRVSSIYNSVTCAMSYGTKSVVKKNRVKNVTKEFLDIFGNIEENP